MKKQQLRTAGPSGTLRDAWHIVPCRSGARYRVIMEQSEYEVMAAVESQHWWYGGMRAISAALLDQVYAGRHDLYILDAGCGTGGNALFLKRYGTVVGIDLAAAALEYGGPRLPGILSRASVLDLPFATASFDLVTSFDVLYHRAVPDEARALAETWRVLKPNGRLLIRLPAYEFLRSKHDRAVHTRRRYTIAEARALLEARGFIVERNSYINSLLFVLPLAQRLVERALPALERPESDLALPAPPINEVLRWPLATEAAWLARGGAFPIGLSILALARKQ
jgi:SAM-dependent methyltransferase